MSAFRPVPKPVQKTETEQRTERYQKLRDARDRWNARAIERAKSKPKKPVKQRNEKRIARKAATYRKVLASDFHKELRYLAYQRSSGFCECYQCAGARRNPEQYDQAARERAMTEILCWFTKRGTKDYLRFHSKDGELHHLNYKFFGDENWAELEFVQWTHKACHQRIEAQHHTRRRFLKRLLSLPQ